MKQYFPDAKPLKCLPLFKKKHFEELSFQKDLLGMYLNYRINMLDAKIITSPKSNLSNWWAMDRLLGVKLLGSFLVLKN